MSTPNPSLSPGLCAQLAAILEVTAPKAGNVQPGRGFADASHIDFLVSAAAVAPVLDRAPGRPLGETILDAIERTRAVVTHNTNLGIVLLAAPLAAVHGEEPLDGALRRLIAATTLRDAELVYEAIRIASPGGLGEAPEQDVRVPPTVTLAEAMRLAADRDLIARQYAVGFVDVLGTGVPALEEGLARGLGAARAAVYCHLCLLRELPDTLIARKAGADAAREASRGAAETLSLGWPESPAARRRFDELDRWLRSRGNRLNPGATADLVAASLHVAIRDGVVPIPFPQPG